MRILIVENDESDLNEILTLFDKFQEHQDFKLDIIVKTNIDTIMKEHDNFDIIILDIELDNTNGIDLARTIRKENKDIRIIFISNYNRYLVDGYKARADLYLLKPVNQIQFNKEMRDIAWDYIYSNQGMFNPKIHPSKIYFKNILYIEILQRKSIIHLTNKQEISCYYTLKKWISIISDAPFAQPHRSFYINLSHIKEYKINEVIMEDNTSISITDVYRKNFQTEYFRYINRSI